MLDNKDNKKKQRKETFLDKLPPQYRKWVYIGSTITIIAVALYTLTADVGPTSKKDEIKYVLTDKNADLDDFGRLLDVEWRLKRQTGNKISTDKIDEIYNRGLAAGALGGKLLGAGGGGFFIFYVPEDKREGVLNEFKELIHIPFKFEDGGSQIIYNGREKYIQRCER